MNGKLLIRERQAQNFGRDRPVSLLQPYKVLAYAPLQTHLMYCILLDFDRAAPFAPVLRPGQ